MKGDDFFDTNILVYAYDEHEPEKQRIAQEILLSAVTSERGVLSIQVLNVFVTVVTRKIPKPLTLKKTREIIRFLSVLVIQGTDITLVNRAIDGCEKYNISYWDSLIIAAAERAGCKRILSEDLNVGQQYFGIELVNPFM